MNLTQRLGSRLQRLLLSIRLRQDFAAVGVSALAYILRMPRGWRNPTFWAEDGAVFFLQDFELGSGALFRPYAGYLHSLMRFFAFGIGYFDIAMAVWLYKVAAFLVFISLLLYLTSDRMGLSVPKRAAFILVMGMFPHGGEIFGNLANQMSTACLLMLVVSTLTKPLTALRGVRDITLLVVCALTGPYVLFLGPAIVLHKLMNFKSRLSPKNGDVHWLFSVIGILTGSAIVHLLTMDIGPRLKPVSTDILIWLKVGARFFWQLYFANLKVFLVLAALISALLGVVTAWILLAKATEFKKFLGSKSLLYSYCGLSVFAAAISTISDQPDVASAFGAGMRYFFIPYVCILWALAAKPQLNFWQKYFRNALLIFSLSSGAFYYHSLISYTDLNLPEQITRYRAEDKVLLRINPPGWIVDLDTAKCWRCSQ
ncbi:MAG: hypothetical protein COT74_10985 [Bdellovibrionales bacterium CG10_big_fil_rev_8_21_14_0_10_45_34]|nr:MAG: hypothetical protein COT74_10985 [Bdellovibrionales bacterium CG10_big_fil_rev_8_21_14_0_10_45_34]